MAKQLLHEHLHPVHLVPQLAPSGDQIPQICIDSLQQVRLLPLVLNGSELAPSSIHIYDIEGMGVVSTSIAAFVAD